MNNPSNKYSLILSHLCGDLLAYLSQVVTEENDLSGLHHVYFMMQWNFWCIDNTNAMNHIFGMFLHFVGFWFDENKTSNLELLIFEIILSVFLQLPSYHLCVWSIFIIKLVATHFILSRRSEKKCIVVFYNIMTIVLFIAEDKDNSFVHAMMWIGYVFLLIRSVMKQVHLNEYDFFWNFYFICMIFIFSEHAWKSCRLF